MKILIIRFSSIGDIVLTSPVIRCLKNQLQNVSIHFLTKPDYKGLLEANPYIDKVLSLHDELSGTVEEIKSENYDEIIDLHNNLRTRAISLKLNRQFKRFNKLNIQKWLQVNLKWNILPELHIVDRYMEAVKHLNVTVDSEGLDYFIPEEDLISIKQALPETHHNGYIAIAIGALHYTKRLPISKLLTLCKKIQKPIVLLGAKEEIENANEVEKVLGSHIYNACGKYNLNQSASLVQQSTIVISNDTGLMHIASALKKKLISIWGNTIPEFGMYPYTGTSGELFESHIIQVKGLSCRPCSKLGHSTCPKKHFRCMMDQDLDQIAQLCQ